jgi:hypothetical protein
MRRKLLFQVSRIPLKALATENGERETGNGKRGTINGRIHNGGASFLPFFLAA